MDRRRTQKETRLQALADVAAPALAVLEEIPVLGPMVKAYGVGTSISDRLFLRKIKRFLEGFEEVGGPTANEFAEEIERDETVAERVAEAVLLSIDAITDLEKAPILAYIYAAYLRNQIGLDTLRRLLAAVNLSMVDDLWDLAAEPSADGRWEEGAHMRRRLALEALRTTGLAALSDTSFQLTGRRSFTGTEVTQLGETLIRILRDAHAKKAAAQGRTGA